MDESRKVASKCRAVLQKLEGHSRMLNKVSFNEVPCDKTNTSDNERCKNVHIRPWVRLTTPNQAYDEYSGRNYIK